MTKRRRNVLSTVAVALSVSLTLLFAAFIMFPAFRHRVMLVADRWYVPEASLMCGVLLVLFGLFLFILWVDHSPRTYRIRRRDGGGNGSGRSGGWTRNGGR